MTAPGVTLLIDAGNTRVKFGWLQREHKQREPAALALAHGELDLHLPDWLKTLPRAPDQAVGVSVAGDAIVARLERHLMQHCGTTIRWQRSTACAAGITNLYENPGQLGNDRWFSLLGLAGHTQAAAILASFGTATTIDTLGPVGAPPESGANTAGTRRFEGGLILPGPELMRKALAGGTAGLPYAEGGSVDFPRNTHAAISSGIAAAQAGAVIRQWRCALDSLGSAPQLYCTGGGWPIVAAEVTEALARAYADLGMQASAALWLDTPVLDGLARIAAEPAA